MKAIVNVNRHWGIGLDGDLLVNIPEDMSFFRKTTAGSIVIMGRKTLDSFPGMKPLKGRVNIVLTGDASRIKKESIAAADVYVYDIASEGTRAGLETAVHKVLELKDAPASERPTVLAAAGSVDEAVEFLKQYPQEVQYVIGGASVYERMLPYCDTCIVTINDSESIPDTFFPALDRLPEWKHSEIGEMKEYNGIHYHFDTFTREKQDET